MNKMKLLQHLQPSLLTLFAFPVILIPSYCSAETSCNVLQGDKAQVRTPVLPMGRGRPEGQVSSLRNLNKPLR